MLLPFLAFSFQELRGTLQMSNVVKLHFAKSAKRTTAPRGTSPVHSIRLRITDDDDPGATRWEIERAILFGSGGRALRGFTDRAAIAGSWHYIAVKPQNLGRFLRIARTAVVEGRADVRIDGRRWQPLKRRA